MQGHDFAAVLVAIQNKHRAVVEVFRRYGVPVNPLPEEDQVHRSESSISSSAVTSGDEGPLLLHPWQSDEQEQDLDYNLKHSLSQVLARTGISLQTIKGLAGVFKIAALSDGGLSVWHSIFVVTEQQGPVICDLFWIESAQDRVPVLLWPGLDLDALLRDYVDAGLAPDCRSASVGEAWAALKVFLGTVDVSPALPLPEEVPFPQGGEVVRLADPNWRKWHFFTGPEGPVVELLLFEDNALVRRTVAVPATGVGMRILDQKTVLAASIPCSVPCFARTEQGDWAGYRILGPAPT
jgi:hypothetical protein